MNAQPHAQPRPRWEPPPERLADAIAWCLERGAEIAYSRALLQIGERWAKDADAARDDLDSEPPATQ